MNKRILIIVFSLLVIGMLVISIFFGLKERFAPRFLEDANPVVAVLPKIIVDKKEISDSALPTQEEQCVSDRYRKQVFSNVLVKKDIPYGKAKNIKGEEEVLLLDLYVPKGDSLTSRPLIIFAHGGGFKGGDKAEGYLPTYMNSFAKLGYVVASVNYRIGIESPQSEKHSLEAGWRAMQDLRAAVRFAHAQASKIGVDESRIFLNGSSAGGATSLNVLFMDEGEVSSLIDQKKWGDIRGSSGSLGYSENIAGLVSLWGAVDDIDVVDKTPLPVGLIHSKNDPTVPYNYAKGLSGLYTYGSLPIYEKLIGSGSYAQLKTNEYSGHEIGLQPPYLSENITWVATFLAPLVGCE